MITKKSKIIIVIIFSIISIIFVLFSYFGYIRYIKLKYTSSLYKYIENYSKLPKSDLNNRVVISLSNQKNKIDNLTNMLISILDQTVKVDQISLNLPLIQVTTLPNIYNTILNIFHTNIDYGNYENIIPCILREGNSDTKIICLNNNYIYGIDFIESMVDESNNYPDKIIYYKGIDDEYSVLIKPKFFTVDIIESIKNNININILDYFPNNIYYINNNETYKI